MYNTYVYIYIHMYNKSIYIYTHIHACFLLIELSKSTHLFEMLFFMSFRTYDNQILTTQWPSLAQKIRQFWAMKGQEGHPLQSPSKKFPYQKFSFHLVPKACRLSSDLRKGSLKKTHQSFRCVNLIISPINISNIEVDKGGSVAYIHNMLYTVYIYICVCFICECVFFFWGGGGV